MEGTGGIQANYMALITFSAPGSLGKEEAKAETFRWNPAGNQPRPAELASGRKRVLRGAGATRAAKRSGYRNRSGDASIGGKSETGGLAAALAGGHPHEQQSIPCHARQRGEL